MQKDRTLSYIRRIASEGEIVQEYCELIPLCLAISTVLWRE